MATQRRRSAAADWEVTSGSVDETQALGERLGRLLRPGDVLALTGELGSGKTTLIQGIAPGLGVDPGMVKSPTFVLMREYLGTTPLIHVDGYRLEGNAAGWFDVDLLFSPHKVTVVEWAERFGLLMPGDALEVRMSHVTTNRRRIALRADSPRGRAVIEALRAQPATAAVPKGDDDPRD